MAADSSISTNVGCSSLAKVNRGGPVETTPMSVGWMDVSWILGDGWAHVAPGLQRTEDVDLSVLARPPGDVRKGHVMGQRMNGTALRRREG